MSKFKLGQLVVLTIGISSCGCNTADKGTIGKITEEGDDDNAYQIQFCKEGCNSPVYESQMREISATEKAKATRRFNKADNYDYATIN